MHLVDEAGIKELVKERVRDLHLSYGHRHDVLLGARVLLISAGPLERILLDHKVVQTASKRPNIDSRGHLTLTVILTLLLQEFRSGEGEVACEVLTFEQFEVVVGEPNQVKHWLAIEPMQSGRMDVTMDKSVVVHVRYRTRYLPEN